MEAQRKCRQCGKGLPADAPGGLCPECLLKLGLASESQEPPNPGGEIDFATAPYHHDAGRGNENDVTLVAGQQFGGYRIVGRLGSGGMGTVYEADQLESGRRVALKVLSHRLDSPEAKQRFLREGRLAASVNHPNSVYVFGTEEIAGAPVIAMELVPGGTLQERVLREGPLPVADAVDDVLQVIDGLEAAAAGGVLHRDVKPANCFVDREGAVKVGDFGLSISKSLRGETNVTSDGTFLGTPAFSSPEQLRGDELDVRSDIYAVGVTLYYLLTGQLPFKADNPVRLIASVLEHPPKPPAELRSDIPNGLNRAVLHCLEKQPPARFKSYDELRQALAPYSSAAPTPAALGLRLGAGVLDHLLCTLILSPASLIWFQNIDRMSRPDYYGSLHHNVIWASTALLYLIYFCIPEGLWGASLGKAICGLRVVTPQRNAAGVPRALLRAAVYVLFPQAVGLLYVGLLGVGVLPQPSMWLVQLVGLSWFVLLALMFTTARRRNGYAGLHDLASNTRVVLKSHYQTRPVLPSDGQLPPQTEMTPMVGPYHVLSSLDKNGDTDLLLGYDTRLFRKVWIRRLPDDAPPVTADVRDLARPGRLRWLAGRRAPGECWDAYEAPSGSPLVNLLTKPQPWGAVRYWLVDMADELAAAEKHQSRPAVLALDRIWITPENRARLLDFPAPGVDPHGSWANSPELPGDESTSFGPFLHQIAVGALEGHPVEPEESRRQAVAVPLPLRAQTVLQELPEIESAEQFAYQLKPLLARTASITRARRLGMLAACILPLLWFLGMMSFGRHLADRWRETHPDVAPLYNCVWKIEVLERGNGPADEDGQQQLRDLELYIAGRFAGTITDPDVWTHTYVTSVFNESQRQIAERAVAAHPDPSADELAEATARLQPVLHELPDELPGLTGGLAQTVAFVVAFAMGNVFVLIAVPSVISAVLFRRSLLMYIFGVTLVTRDGTRASRLRAVWRSLLTWSPAVLCPVLIVALTICGMAITWSVSISVVLLIAAIVWSVSLPERGIPDRLAGTYPVPG